MNERRRPGPLGRAVHGLWPLAGWSLTVGLAYSGAGEWLGEAAEGISPLYRPTGLLLLTALAAVAALVLTLVWASQPAGSAEADDEDGALPDLDRRRFLGRSLGVGLGGL